MLDAQRQDRVLQEIGEIARVKSVSVVHDQDMYRRFGPAPRPCALKRQPTQAGNESLSRA